MIHKMNADGTIMYPKELEDVRSGIVKITRISQLRRLMITENEKGTVIEGMTDMELEAAGLDWMRPGSYRRSQGL